MKGQIATPQRRVLRRANTKGNTLFPICTSAGALSIIAVVSFFVGLGDDARSVIISGVAAVVLAAISVTIWRTVERPTDVDAPTMFTMTTIGWLTLIAGSAGFHAAAGVTDSLDVAIFEGTATATTTAMTTLDPEELPRAVLLFRAATQWVAGFGALLVAIIVIPLASGTRELAKSQGVKALNPARTGGLGRMARIYAGGTVVLAVAFLAAGLHVFDAVAHALTTVSTGGLATKNGSLAGLDSAAAEWVAGFGMAIAGLNIMAVWWILQGNVAAIRRGAELRLYLAVMAVSTLVLFMWLGDDATVHGALRTAFVTVASAMSTTGFTTIPWNSLDPGPIALLTLLMGVGAMAGSTGGGFRYLRVMEAAKFARRELQRQVHPNSVAVVKIGGRVISERSLDRLHGYTLMFAATATLGAMLIALADTSLGVMTALSMSLSALVTAGPVVGETSSPGFGELGATSHIALSIVMLLGRLSIYPVLMAVMTVYARTAWIVRESRLRREVDA